MLFSPVRAIPISEMEVTTGEGKVIKRYANLSQSNKIKKLRYAAESAEEQSGNLLKPHALKRHGRDIFYGVSVFLCIAAIFVAFSKLFCTK